MQIAISLVLVGLWNGSTAEVSSHLPAFVVGKTIGAGHTPHGAPVRRRKKVPIEETRRDRARRLGLASARIVVYRQTVTPYPKIELSARDRAELVAVLDDVGTYYDWPGVIACVCDRRNEVVLELHLKERDLEASFCSTCQRIYSWGPEADELNLPLSAEGTKALEGLFERVVGASPRQ